MKSILSLFLTIIFVAAIAFGNPNPVEPPLEVTPGESYMFEFQNPRPEDQKSWEKLLKNQRFRISTGGYINFPYVGNLKLGGLPFKGAEEALEEALRRQNLAINLRILWVPLK